MKILLVHPPVSHDMPDVYRADSLGLAYIAAVLRRDGHDVEVFDACLRRIDAKVTVDEVLKREFDCLGISSAYSHKDNLLTIVKAVRKARRDVLIIAGGYLPTLSTEYLLQECPELSFVVMGEGETVISDVMGRIERGEEWRDTQGIAFVDGNKPVLNPLPPLIKDLDTLPFPARDALSQADFPVPAGIASSRGCYHNCSFCCVQSFYTLYGHRVPRFRSPDRVVDEMESVVAETGIREFRFVDDDFIGPGEKARRRTIQLANEIINRKLDIQFKIELRADEVDAEVIAILKEAGLSYVFIGVESGVQRQLDLYNKRTTVEQNKQAIEIVRKSGVKVRAGFIMFDPYITVPEIQENIQFIKDTRLDEDAKADFAPLLTRLVIHRGVPLEEQLRNDGLLIERGLDLEYKFQDPGARMMIKYASASEKISGFFKGFGRIFRK